MGEQVTRPLMLAVIAVAIGSGFHKDYSSRVISVGLNTEIFRPQNASDNEPWQETHELIEMQSRLLIATIYGAGSLIGTVLIPVAANNIGRKGTLQWVNIISLAIPIVESIITYQNVYSVLFPVLMSTRFLLSILNAINFGVGIIYLVEISPIKYRGIIGSVCPLFKLVGSLTIDLISSNDDAHTIWPWLIAASIIPTLIMLSTLYFCPESAIFLVYCKRNTEKAQNELFRLRSANGNEETEVSTELQEYNMENSSASTSLPTCIDMFNVPELRKPLIISIIILLGAWLIGPYYLTPKHELPISNKLQIIISTTAGTVGVLISMCTVEKVGRIPLFLVGLSSVCINLIVYFIYIQLWVGENVFGIIVYIVLTFFYCLQSLMIYTIPWLMICELSSNVARPMNFAISLIVFKIINSFYEFLSSCFTFLGHDHYSALLEVLIIAMFIVYVKHKVPETKGKTFRAIQSFFME